MTTRNVVIFAIVALVSVASAAPQLPKPEVLSKVDNPAPAPLSDRWAQDRKTFIADCESHGGAAVPRAGIVGSDGLVCVALLGQ
jgi:hypothetical protein